MDIFLIVAIVIIIGTLGYIAYGINKLKIREKEFKKMWFDNKANYVVHPLSEAHYPMSPTESLQQRMSKGVIGESATVLRPKTVAEKAYEESFKDMPDAYISLINDSQNENL